MKHERRAASPDAAAEAAVPARAGKTDPLDVLVGRRIRRLRVARGLTQTELGQAINVTFQQVQKYEAGTNRVAASTLLRVAEALDVAPDALLTGDGSAADPAARSSLLSTPGAEALLAAYARLGSETLRGAALALVRGMSGERANSTPENSDIAADGLAGS